MTYLSRKFILACTGLVLGAALLLLDKLSGTEFVTLTLGLSGAYMTANVWGKDR